MKKRLRILGAPGVLIIATFIDISYYKTSRFDPISFQPPISSLFWLRILGTIFVTILLLGLAWYLLCGTRSDLIESAVYVLCGACILVATTIPSYQFLGRFESSFSNSLQTLVGEIIASDLSLTSHSAAFILCIGLFRLRSWE